MAVVAVGLSSCGGGGGSDTAGRQRTVLPDSARTGTVDSTGMAMMASGMSVPVGDREAEAPMKSERGIVTFPFAQLLDEIQQLLTASLTIRVTGSNPVGPIPPLRVVAVADDGTFDGNDYAAAPIGSPVVLQPLQVDGNGLGIYTADVADIVAEAIAMQRPTIQLRIRPEPEFDMDGMNDLVLVEIEASEIAVGFE